MMIGGSSAGVSVFVGVAVGDDAGGGDEVGEGVGVAVGVGEGVAVGVGVGEGVGVAVGEGVGTGPSDVWVHWDEVGVRLPAASVARARRTWAPVVRPVRR
jgi:hypothetical protein